MIANMMRFKALLLVLLIRGIAVRTAAQSTAFPASMITGNPSALDFQLVTMQIGGHNTYFPGGRKTCCSGSESQIRFGGCMLIDTGHCG